MEIILPAVTKLAEVSILGAVLLFVLWATFAKLPHAIYEINTKLELLAKTYKALSNNDDILRMLAIMIIEHRNLDVLLDKLQDDPELKKTYPDIKRSIKEIYTLTEQIKDKLDNDQGST